tara:strand:+ start:172 stop:411 length:240 start_codon:yes stop_codon:yes gene_type:complete
MEDQADKKVEKPSNEEKNKGWQNSGLMNYSDKEKQTVFKMFGIELTAPAGLKNPGTIYISFIVVNIIMFVILKSLISNN